VNTSEPFGCPGSGGGDLNESTSECRYGGGSTRLYCQVVLTYGVPTNVAVGEADDAAVGEGLGVGDADAEAVGVGL